MKRLLLVALLGLTSITQCIPSQAVAADAPLVAIASSLRQVWPALINEYRTQNLLEPRVTFGSSGNLARQIAQGAPFDLFLSADQAYPKWLVEMGATNFTPAVYTQGRLVWVTPKGSTLANWLSDEPYDSINDTDAVAIKNANADKAAIVGTEGSTDTQRTLKNQPTALAQIPKGIKRLSIANPAFAPYGQAAQTVLSAHGLSSQVQLTLGENAVQALQFALSGASDGGIVPRSLVNAQAIASLPPMHILEIPAGLHQPLIHSMVIIGEPTSDTSALFDFLLSDNAQRLLIQNGFRMVQ